MIMSAAVPTVMAETLTQAITLIALVDFFALKYLHANVKYKMEYDECDESVEWDEFRNWHRLFPHSTS